jgi:hypothetical protein
VRYLAWLLVACLLSCGMPQPKFAKVADLLCDELEEFQALHNGILSVHMLLERGDYEGALKVADTLLVSLDENQEVEGARELRALIFLLESIVKGTQK